MADRAPWAELADQVAEADTVVAVGAGTHAELGGAVIGATTIRVPSGVVGFEPADMTVKVNAGTSFAELQAALAEHGQECPLDPRDPVATLGGIVASGLSGPRRLGVGPLRDHLLETTMILADGRVVRGGGPTVKNVSGYDIPRLVVGSFGTLGVVVQLILRTRPIAAARQWFTTLQDPSEVAAALFRPSALLWDGTNTTVLLEGHAPDLTEQARSAALTPLVESAIPGRPAGPHRGRIAIEPARIAAIADGLTDLGARWTAELRVGTVHVATDTEADLGRARRLASAQGGWLLREAGAPTLDPFGMQPPAAAVQRRLRQLLDPTAKLSPGRVLATQPQAGVAA
ncbi:MAG: FAD-binding protein [Acidimicrobiia bacterium]|nr:FAD-binding protein [Acidimicrobiia bacterium]